VYGHSCALLWETHELRSTDHVVYSSAYNLSLRLFEPPESATEGLRPAIVVIHGGSFRGGSRNDDYVVDMAEHLARLGYTAASIDYRLVGAASDALTFPCTTVACHEVLADSTLAAAHDARTAVRWLRANSVSLQIDPQRIGAWGASSGGMVVAAMLAYPDEGDGSGISSELTAGVSVAGALPSDMDGYTSTADPPLTSDTFEQHVASVRLPHLNFHSCGDPIVPYEDALATMSLMQAAGADAQMYSWDTAAHVHKALTLSGAALEALDGFLAAHLGPCPSDTAAASAAPSAAPSAPPSASPNLPPTASPTSAAPTTTVPTHHRVAHDRVAYHNHGRADHGRADHGRADHGRAHDCRAHLRRAHHCRADRRVAHHRRAHDRRAHVRVQRLEAELRGCAVRHVQAAGRVCRGLRH
jgi:acetyl esterase/lipase